MRDPVDAKIEAAREEARELIGYLVRGEVGSDEDIARLKTWNWLFRARAGAAGPMPQEVFDDLYRRMDRGFDSAVAKKRGRRANTTRDSFIARVVAHLVAKYALDATRNAASPRASACSIVADILAEIARDQKENGFDIGESAVVHIWSRRAAF
jgi:hypothetical protein